jgi:hypothetical protein
MLDTDGDGLVKNSEWANARAAMEDSVISTREGDFGPVEWYTRYIVGSTPNWHF